MHEDGPNLAVQSTAPEATATLKPRNWRRLVLWGLLGLALIPGWRLYYILLGGNFHVVAEGQCYRGAQPTPEEMTAIVKRHAIRTVINMRGVSEDEPWYPIEVRTAQELGVKFVDVGIWSSAPPPIEEFHKLIHSLSNDPAPFYMHCLHGSDRTGLAAVFFLLLRTDATLPEARRQLSLHFGHVPHGPARCQDRLLDCYETWLRTQNLSHSADLLRRWGLEVYNGQLD